MLVDYLKETFWFFLCSVSIYWFSEFILRQVKNKIYLNRRRWSIVAFFHSTIFIFFVHKKSVYISFTKHKILYFFLNRLKNIDRNKKERQGIKKERERERKGREEGRENEKEEWEQRKKKRKKIKKDCCNWGPS